MFFSTEDYRKIEKWLLANSKKDTDFPEGTLPLSGDEIIAIVQDGINKKLPVSSLIEQVELSEHHDFMNVTERLGISHITINQAIDAIPVKKRQLGQVISFLNDADEWVIYQYQGTDLIHWGNPDNWKNLFDFEIDYKFPKLSVTLADEEDLTTEVVDDTEEQITYKIRLKDKVYSEDDFSGYGRVWLKKNIVTDPGNPEGETGNFLTQEMLTQKFTIYNIQYDFSIPTGVELLIPEGAVLNFIGGSIDGPGTIGFTGENFLIGEPIKILAHVSRCEADNGKESGIYQTTIHTSWFPNITAEDINELTFNTNIILIDSPVTIKSQVAIYGGIDYSNQETITVSPTFTIPTEEVLSNAVLTLYTNNTNQYLLPHNVSIRSANTKLSELIRITQIKNSIPVKYYFNITNASTNINNLPYTVIHIDNTYQLANNSTELYATNAVISGLVNMSTRSTQVVKAQLIQITSGKETKDDETYQENLDITFKDLYVTTVQGGTTNLLNKDNCSFINGTDTETTKLTLDNVEIGSYTQGTIIRGKFESINIDKFKYKLDNGNIIYLLNQYFSIDTKELNISNCNISLPLFSGTSATPLTEYVMFDINNADKVRITDTTIDVKQVGLGNIFKFTNSKNIDVNATLLSDGVTTSFDNSAIKLGTACYGNFNINAQLPNCTLFETSTNITGDVNLTVNGNTSIVWNNTGDKSTNKKTIKNSNIHCTKLFYSGDLVSNVTIADNIIDGDSLFSCANMVVQANIVDNIFNLLFSDSPSSIIESAMMNIGNISNNVINTTSSASYSLPLISVSQITSATIIDNNTALGSPNQKLFRSNVLNSTSIVNNIIYTLDKNPIQFNESAGTTYIVQDNKIFDVNTKKNLNDDGTDKSKVTIV